MANKRKKAAAADTDLEPPSTAPNSHSLRLPTGNMQYTVMPGAFHLPEVGVENVEMEIQPDEIPLDKDSDITDCEPPSPPALNSHDVHMTDPAVISLAPELPSLQPSSIPVVSDSTVVSASSEPSSPPLEPRDSLAEESPFWFWQLILITTAWLHLHYHTPHRACTLLLKVLRNIFLCLGLFGTEENVPVTLATTFKKLGLNEDFEIRAICPQCRRAYPEDSPADLMCEHCHIPLFNAAPPPTSSTIPLLASTRPKSKGKSRPVLQAPYLLPSTQIVEFLNREGNEVACESYLKRTHIPGKMQDIQDGNICQSLKAPDGRKFFDTAPDRPDPDELRIGLCFGEDGQVVLRGILLLLTQPQLLIHSK
ncbi:hypothetical protein C8R44DRAFT_882147 [Mycena epipterygia]|nr:hypothetical protein C8R44DRAFT_882147 [Mycena epipterygia]